MNPWSILEIEPTKDKKLIKKSYSKKLPANNPEDNPQGFMELRKAYEFALSYADSYVEEYIQEEIETENEREIEKEQPNIITNNYKKNIIIQERLSEKISVKDKLHELYMDFFKRIQLNNWKRLINTLSFDEHDFFVKSGFDFFRENHRLPLDILDYIINELNEENKNLFKEIKIFDYDMFYEGMDWDYITYEECRYKAWELYKQERYKDGLEYAIKAFNIYSGENYILELLCKMLCYEKRFKEAKKYYCLVNQFIHNDINEETFEVEEIKQSIWYKMFEQLYDNEFSYLSLNKWNTQFSKIPLDQYEHMKKYAYIFFNEHYFLPYDVWKLVQIKCELLNNPLFNKRISLAHDYNFCYEISLFNIKDLYVEAFELRYKAVEAFINGDYDNAIKFSLCFIENIYFHEYTLHKLIFQSYLLKKSFEEAREFIVKSRILKRDKKQYLLDMMTLNICQNKMGKAFFYLYKSSIMSGKNKSQEDILKYEFLYEQLTANSIELNESWKNKLVRNIYNILLYGDIYETDWGNINLPKHGYKKYLLYIQFAVFFCAFMFLLISILYSIMMINY